MAYNSGGTQSPFVSSISPQKVSVAGNATFTIDGALFSPSMKVEVPSGLGSLVSVAISRLAATTYRAVIVVNVNAPAATPTNYNITLSNGGESDSNSQATVALSTAFSPEDLVLSSSDGWFQPDGMRNSSGQTPSNGDNVVEWLANGSTSGLSKFYQSTSIDQPIYVAAHTGWDSSTNHPAIRDSADGTASYFITAADGSWTRTSSENYTMAMVLSPTADNSSWGRAFIRWVEDVTNTHPNWYHDFLFYTGGAYNVASQRNDIVSRVRGNSASHNEVFSIPTPRANTAVMILRKNGTEGKVYYNSSTAVQTYTSPDNVTADAAGAQIYVNEAVMAEALFLKYAASDSQITDLMDYWTDKYGA